MVSDYEADNAAADVADTYDLDDGQARDLVDVVAEAIEDGRSEDAMWEVQDRDPSLDAEAFTQDVTGHLGYDEDSY